MILIVLTFLSLITYIGGPIVFLMIGFVYPAYKSFKAIESKKEKAKKEKEILHYLRYWIVFAFLYTVSPILAFIPYWKVIHILVCMLLWSTKL